MARTPSADPRVTFEQALNDAITQGRMPAPGIGLGPNTHAAIAAVAREHPEATVEVIVTAYDAFAHEHA